MGEPVYMLNVLWFKKDGGLEKYIEYGTAAYPLLAEAGAEVGEYLHPESSIIGDFDADLVFIVKYPSRAAFDAMISSPAYVKILQLRKSALDKSLLIECKAFNWSIGT